MSKKPNKSKNKHVQVVQVNKHRRIAMIANPIIMIFLIILIFMHVPMEVVIGIGVAAYAIWGYFFVRGNVTDWNTYKKKRR